MCLHSSDLFGQFTEAFHFTSAWVQHIDWGFRIILQSFTLVLFQNHLNQSLNCFGKFYPSGLPSAPVFPPPSTCLVLWITEVWPLAGITVGIVVEAELVLTQVLQERLLVLLLPHMTEWYSEPTLNHQLARLQDTRLLRVNPLVH